MNGKVLCCIFIFFHAAAYDFYGTHFLASYKSCDSAALKDIETLKKKLIEAVKSSGAQLLQPIFWDFDSQSTTGTLILSESHASIHTYPEHRACFVDLFTCGSHCSWEPFHTILIAYLQPEVIGKRVIHRS